MIERVYDEMHSAGTKRTNGKRATGGVKNLHVVLRQCLKGAAEHSHVLDVHNRKAALTMQDILDRSGGCTADAPQLRVIDASKR